MRTEQIFLEWQASSNLGTVEQQMERLIELARTQSTVVAQEVANINLQYDKQRAALRENERLAIEIAKQTTAAQKTELAERLAQTKAAEERMTEATKQAERQRTAESAALARQATIEFIEQQRQTTAALETANKQRLLNEKATLDAANQAARQAGNEQQAILRADLREQQAARDAASREALISLKADEDRATAARKAELTEQTLAIKAALQQQTDAYKAEQREQLLAMRQTKTGVDEIVSGLRDMRTIVGASFSLYEVIQFSKQIIDAKTEVDRFKMGLTQMIGSKREMNDLYVQTIQLANETPFEVEKLFDTVFTLKGMGVATQELIPTLEALGNMAAVAGQEKLPLIAKAFTDTMNKGKLMKQEINQFAENGIPLYDLLAASMDKPREAIIKLAENHEISFAQVKKAIMDASQEGGRYYQMMAIQAETLGGQVSNLKDRFFVAKAIVGDYFEEGLGKSVTGLKSLVVNLAGSDSAIKRTVTYTEALLILWGSWTLANSRLIASLTAQRTAMVAASVATTAYNAIVGTFYLVMITATGFTDLFTAAQVRSAVAARAMWASLAANPIGLVIGLVGTAVAAYTAWSAATEKVTTVVTDQHVALERERKAMETAIENTMQLEIGTKGRIAAVQMLINKYPDYFAGMQAEAVTNEQLRTTLERVNGSYRTRIELAAEAYRAELNEEKFKGLVKRTQEIMDLAKERLPKELMILIDGDPKKLLDAIDGIPKYADMLNGKNAGYWKTIGNQWSDMWQGHSHSVLKSLQEAQKGMNAYEEELKAGENRKAKIRADALAEDLATERDRHTKVLAQLKAANDHSVKDEAEYRAKRASEEKLFADNMLRIQGKTHQDKQTNEEGHGGKMKAITLNSQAAIRLAQLQFDADSLFNQIERIKAQEKVETEAVNKQYVNSKASQAELAGIRAEALGQIQQIHAKAVADENALRRQAALDLLKSAQQNVDIERDAAEAIVAANQKSKAEINRENKAAKAEQIKDAREIAKEISDSQAEIQRLHTETAQLQRRAHRDQIGLIFDMVGQLDGMNGSMLQGIKAFYSQWDVLSGASRSAAQQRYDEADKEQARYLNMFLAGDKEAEAMAAKMGVAKAKAQQDIAQIDAATQTAALGLVSMILQLAKQLFETMNQMHTDTYQAISTAMEQSIELNQQYFGTLMDIEKSNLDALLLVYQDNYAQRSQLISEFYDRQRELVNARDVMDDLLATNKAYADALLAAGRDTVWNHRKYKAEMAEAEITIERDKYMRQQQMLINQAEIDKAQAEQELQEKIARIDAFVAYQKKAIEEEIQLLKDGHAIKSADLKAALDADLLALKNRYDSETALNKAAVEEVNTAYKTNTTNLKSALDADLAELKVNYDARKRQYEDDVANVKSASEERMAAVRAEQEAEKAALQETYALKQQLNEQEKADEVETVGILDRVRSEALERYRADEVARITATRDRILSTLTDEGERAQVTAEYDRQLAALHETVEQGKLDKTKGVSLASTQIRNEEKAEAERLKTEEKAALEALEDKFQAKFKALTEERDRTLQTLKDAQDARDLAYQAARDKREDEYQARFDKLTADRDTTLQKFKDDQEARDLQYKQDKERLETDLKNKLATLETELAGKIKVLQDQIKANEIKAAWDKSKANETYASDVLAANQAIFAATKAMKIAELQAEIAILKAKRNWFNAGKINAAIDDINAAIGEIAGINFNGGGPPVVSTPAQGGSGSVQTRSEGELRYMVDMNAAGARDKVTGGPGRPIREDNLQLLDEGAPTNLYKDGKAVVLYYNVDGKRHKLNDSAGNIVWVAFANGYIPETGEYFAKGTEFVDRAGRHPAGIDTVPAMLTRGERVLTQAQNAALAGISNNELVRRALLMDQIQQAAPMLLNNPVAMGQLTAEVMPWDMGSVLDKLSSLHDALADQPRLHINMDETGFTRSLYTGQAITDYHQNLLIR
ncbi:tape measure protein [Spirosoma sordidisoli]|uniref:Tape measure protein n=1 Tax=Spirosoma sordidisoli TaxID=2502893 RepID=A0A4Q2UC70_9BACT|nr:tape measure protein [Spirosoma sordidisoli]RYC66356.1 hypothetical protein EQG79_30245 [Spirosoma sordidisoli]